ncbi:MAG: HlyD family efflux transporter periplasmic adaptor subunit [Firmicutes bacterium]|nr:HlyD family efflux transporter periplasmic adaptor subunit [Bacillota bacterium]
MRKGSWWKWALAAVIVLAVVGGAGWYLRARTLSAQSDIRYTTVPASRGDITVTVQADGTLASPNAVTVSPPQVSGQMVVTAVHVQNGQTVHKGDPLVDLSDSNLDMAVQRDQIQVQQDLVSLGNLLNVPPSQAMSATLPGEIWVTAPAAGRLQSLNVSANQQVKPQSVLANLVDDRTILFESQVIQPDMERIQPGQKATVVADNFAPDPIPATVVSVDRTGTPGSQTILYTVKLRLTNPGLLQAGMTGQATIQTAQGPLVEQGSFADNDPVQVLAPQTGSSWTVGTVLVSANQWVNAGQRLLSLEANPADATQVSQARLKAQTDQLQLQADLDQQAKLHVVAPVDGVVTDVAVQVGETVGAGGVGGSGSAAAQAGSGGLLTIRPQGDMDLEASVNELDIGQVHVGQAATVTVDAFPGKFFQGTVTEIAGQATSQNGVATFPVWIAVQQPEGLLPGMTGHAQIVVTQRQNVLRVPTEAVVQPSGGLSATPNGRGLVQVLQNGQPVRRVVQLGVVTPAWTEIVSGLNEGEQVIVATSQASSNGGTPQAGFRPFGFGAGPGGRAFGGFGGGFDRGGAGGGTRANTRGGQGGGFGGGAGGGGGNTGGAGQ